MKGKSTLMEKLLQSRAHTPVKCKITSKNINCYGKYIYTMRLTPFSNF